MIEQRLQGLRTTLRFRLVVYGLCAVLAGGIAASIVVMVVDWLLGLPSLLRIIATAVYVVGFGIAAHHWILRPLRARLSLHEIALELENHFAELRDHLASSVQFEARPDEDSAVLAGRVVASTASRLDRLQLSDALATRPLVRSVVLLALAGVFLLGLAVVAPNWLQTGLARYGNPFGEAEWPRTVEIVPLTGDQVVGLGETAEVRLSIARGWREHLRPLVHLIEPEGEKDVLTMQRDDDGSYFATVQTVTENLQYWFEAGDDNTQRKPFTIRVVRRPEVLEATAAIFPPSYAADRPVQQYSLREGPARATVGATARVDVHTSKAIFVGDGDAVAGLQLESGELFPLVPTKDDPTRLSASVVVERDVEFWIELQDPDGFENISRMQYRIEAMPDEIPAVAIVNPKSLVEVTPMGAVDVEIRAVDDYGIVTIDLVAAVEDGSGAETILDLSERASWDSEGQEVVVTARHHWELEPLELVPNNVLRYYARAIDNSIEPDGAGQMGRSPTMEIRIISRLEFDTRLAEDLSRIEMRLRQTLLDHLEVADQTKALEAEIPLREEERQAARALSNQEARLGRRLTDIASRLDEFADRMELNRVGTQDDRAQLEAVAVVLEQTANGAMRDSSAELIAAAETDEQPGQSESLDSARRVQQEASDQLEQLLATVAQWGDFQAVSTRTQDLLELQRDLRNATTELGEATIGKSREALSAAEEAELRKLQRQQEQITKDADKLLERMATLAQGLREHDKPSSDSLDDAVRAASSGDLARSLDQATSAISENRTAAAAIEQRQAEQALQRMVDALAQRDVRRLEELRKRLSEAHEQVRELLDRQSELRAASAEAAQLDADATAFARRQRTIRRNATIVANDLSRIERAVTGAQLVRESTDPMTNAERSLEAAKPRAAVDEQDAALALLEESLLELLQAARSAEEQALKRSLAMLREQLTRVLDAQREINTQAERVASALESAGRMGRAEARTLSRLARDQSGTIEIVDELLPRLETAVVYEWALQRIRSWMANVRTAFQARSVDENVLAECGRIEQELLLLLAGIADIEQLPMPSEFAEQGGGGGGGASGSESQAPVPPLAELLVLKTMQESVNERTRAISAEFDVERATEEELRALKILGETQDAIEALTRKLVSQARNQ